MNKQYEELFNKTQSELLQNGWQPHERLDTHFQNKAIILKQMVLDLLDEKESD